MIEINSKIMYIGTILSFGDLTSVKTTLTLQHLNHELIVLLISSKYIMIYSKHQAFDFVYQKSKNT